MNVPILAFGLGYTELIVVAVIGLLVFGRRLPDVARSVGKSIVEFKKGLREVKDDIDDRSRSEPSKPSKLESQPNSTFESAPSPEPNHDAKPAKESSHTTG